MAASNINKKCVGCYKRDRARRLIQGLELEVCHGCGKDIDFALGFLAVQLEITDEELGDRIISELIRPESESPTPKGPGSKS